VHHTLRRRGMRLRGPFHLKTCRAFGMIQLPFRVTSTRRSVAS
jgi:hypothetical protein